MIETYQRALIVGAGDGLSASVARTFAAAGMVIGLAARNTDKLKALCEQTGALVIWNCNSHHCSDSF